MRRPTGSLLFALALCLSWGSAAGAARTPSFRPNGNGLQAPQLEGKWPPIDEASFRAALLDQLLGGGFRDLAATPRDVTPQFSSSMARFCDMPPDLRAPVLSLEYSRVTHERYEAVLKLLHDNCGLRVFASERNGKRLFVAVYPKRNKPLPGGERVFTAQQEGHTLKVVTLQIPAKPAWPFIQAATIRANQLVR